MIIYNIIYDNNIIKDHYKLYSEVLKKCLYLMR
jgi:hypothetical protein